MVDEAALWVPALKGKRTTTTRAARRRFDYHLKALSNQLGWDALDSMRAHLAAVHLARERMVVLPASGEAGKP